jgi:hypothetical protein
MKALPLEWFISLSLSCPSLLNPAFVLLPVSALLATQQSPDFIMFS